MFCNNYVIEGDTLYMLESVGPVSAAAAGDVDASKAIECPLAPDPVGGVLSTFTRPTLKPYGEASPLVCMSIHPAGKACSNIGRLLVFNDPPARRNSPPASMPPT